MKPTFQLRPYRFHQILELLVIRHSNAILGIGKSLQRFCHPVESLIDLRDLVLQGLELTRRVRGYRSHLKFASRGSLSKAARSYSIDSRGDSHKARAPCASRCSFHDIRSSGSGFVKTVQCRIAKLANP